MAMSRMHRLAAARSVPVFAAVGRDARDRVENLSLANDVELVASPRHARVLLVAGAIREVDREALDLVHDQVPHPRATLWWGSKAPAAFERPLQLDWAVDPRDALAELHAGLLSGERPSEKPRRPDAPPNPWRGLGDFGQGGEGMMGGTPYGRPMPMPPQADLRDGLALDAYSTEMGPFLPPWPPGLALALTLQGDVFQSARMTRAPLPPPIEHAAPFRRALNEPVPIAELEQSRAAHHLRCAARLLALVELAPLAARCRRAARSLEAGQRVSVVGLRKRLRRAGAFAAMPAGLGRLESDALAALGGVVQRAAGAGTQATRPVSSDARAEDSVYRQLGFQPLTQRGGDVRARLAQWLDEAEQAVSLAGAAAATAQTARMERIEAPWGSLRDAQGRPVVDLGDLLAGLEWNEAMLVLSSFDAQTLRSLAPPDLLEPAPEAPSQNAQPSREIP